MNVYIVSVMSRSIQPQQLSICHSKDGPYQRLNSCLIIDWQYCPIHAAMTIGYYGQYGQGLGRGGGGVRGQGL